MGREPLWNQGLDRVDQVHPMCASHPSAGIFQGSHDEGRAFGVVQIATGGLESTGKGKPLVHNSQGFFTTHRSAELLQGRPSHQTQGQQCDPQKQPAKG